MSSILPFLPRSFASHLGRPWARDKADTLFLLIACSLALLPHFKQVPLWCTVACIGLLLWRTWNILRGNRVPSHWILLPLSILAMAGVYASYRTIFGREPGIAMLVLLLTFKLLEMQAKRDVFVVVFLSFFLVLASFFYSQSLVTALFTIAAVIVLFSAQLSFQYTGAVPPLRQRLLLGAKVLLLAAPLTFVLFLFFPRIEGPLWNMPSDSQSTRSGLSNSMSPGNISRLALSDAVAFRVKFFDQPPPKAKLYWRGPVLDSFDGRTWTPLPDNEKYLRPPGITPSGEAIRYQVTLEPSNRHSIFALEAPWQLPQIQGNPTRLSADLQLLARQPITDRIRYDAESAIDFTWPANEAPASLHAWQTLPAGYNPDAIAFAKRLRNQFPDEQDFVKAVLRHFNEENFRYTLEPPLLGRHSVDEFLFSTRAGFCEHYSSAFVVLMRAAGIPARVVTGYQGGEINSVDGFMTVRQSDAHAWAEFWLPNRGWTRVDPTAAVAPNRIERNLSAALPQRLFGGLIAFDNNRLSAWQSSLRMLHHNWDALNNHWNQWVLDYTSDKQKNLLASLGFAETGWRTLVGVLIAASLLALLVVTVPLLRTRGKTDPVDVLYLAFCKRMAQIGYPREVHEGPRAYRERLLAAESAITPQKRAAAQHFLEIYESLRYSAQSPLSSSARPAALLSQLKSLLAACR